jgi:hypothetical protein
MNREEACWCLGLLSRESKQCHVHTSTNHFNSSFLFNTHLSSLIYVVGISQLSAGGGQSLFEIHPSPFPHPVRYNEFGLIVNVPLAHRPLTEKESAQFQLSQPTGISVGNIRAGRNDAARSSWLPTSTGVLVTRDCELGPKRFTTITSESLTSRILIRHR